MTRWTRRRTPEATQSLDQEGDLPGREMTGAHLSGKNESTEVSQSLGRLENTNHSVWLEPETGGHVSHVTGEEVGCLLEPLMQ